MKHCALYLGYLIALLALLLLLWCAHYSYTHTGTHHFVEIGLEDDAFDDPQPQRRQDGIFQKALLRQDGGGPDLQLAPDRPGLGGALSGSGPAGGRGGALGWRADVRARAEP